MAKGIRFRLGKGNNFNMFKDPWIPKELSFKPVCIDRSVWDEKVCDFISPSGVWNISKLNNSVLIDDIDIIRKIHFNPNLDDKLIWH